MTVREIREALRVLRVQSGIATRGVKGLNKSTVHRIENVRDEPNYSPDLRSVALILAACGYTFRQFVLTLDDVQTTTAALGRRDLLAELRDEKTVRQVLGFLALNDQAKAALALASSGTTERGPGLSVAPTRETKRAARTRRRPRRHRSSASDKTGT